MPDESRDAFLPIKDETGRVTGLMDRATADYLASCAPDPTQASIDALLKSITRVHVVPAGNYFLGTTQIRTLLDTSDPASLGSFRACFQISEDPRTFGHCMCCGDPHLELFAGDELIAKIGYHHGFAIRWDAWKHDAQLMEPNRLLDWMSAHGVDGPRHEAEEGRRRAKEYQDHLDRWLKAMPDCLRPFWQLMDHDRDSELHRLLLESLRIALHAPEAQALTLFGWFGSGAGPWSGFPSYESVPEQLLLHYPTQLLIDALQKSPPTITQWHGAARYFGGWEFSQRKKKELAILSTDLKQSLLEAARTTGIADNIARAESAFSERTTR